MAKVKQVEYTINLTDLFGQEVDDETIKEDFAQAVIDRIIERTQSGIDKDGNKFTRYSKEYAKRKGSTHVDLTLFGDMLGTMDLIDIGGDTITLGFPDTTENAKAFNHTTGDTLPRRDFFGLPQKDLEEIASLFESEVKRGERQELGDDVDDLESAAQSFIDRILSGQSDEELF